MSSHIPQNVVREAEHITPQQHTTGTGHSASSRRQEPDDMNHDLGPNAHKSRVLNELDPRVHVHPEHHGTQYHTVSTTAENLEQKHAQPHKAADIPGELEGPVHKSNVLNDLDPRVKAQPGSATTGGHHTLPKVGQTHN